MPQKRKSKKSKRTPKRSLPKKSFWANLTRVRLSRGQAATFLESVSLMVGSGMGVSTAFEALLRDPSAKAIHPLVQKIHDDVEAGVPLWKSFESTKAFKPHVISLLRLGEESGRLSENLITVSKQEQKDAVFRSRLKSALLYPVLVLSLTVIVGLSIAWFILPRLSLVFSQLNIELPFLTHYLIQAGEFLDRSGAIFVPAVLTIFFVGIFFLFIFSKTRHVGQTLLFHIPGIRRLIRDVNVGRLGFLLGTLLEAGMPIELSLRSLTGTASFPAYRKLYQHLEDSIKNGYSFKEAFEQYPRISYLLPTSVTQMIISGEQSGRLADILIEVGTRYELKTETTTKDLTVVLEPILLFIVWIGVVSVALAVIMPIYNLVGNFNSGLGAAIESPPPAPEVVTPDPVIPVAEVAEDATLRIVVDGSLNVREDATSESEIVGQVFNGEVYTYSEVEGEWYEIVLPEDGDFETDSGWVNSEFIIEE